MAEARCREAVWQPVSGRSPKLVRATTRTRRGERRELMFRTGLFGALRIAAASSAQAADAGVTDSEITLGQTMPYSGPASGYSVIGRVEAAYYEMVNAKGGVNGRKIRLISLDDAFSPAKTVEQTRKLFEKDEVFSIFGSPAPLPNSSIHPNLNTTKS